MAGKRGRPTIPKATAGDAESIIRKVEYEFDRFDASLANELPKLLEAYFELAFKAEKENTKKAVMEKLIERAEKKIDQESSIKPETEKPAEPQAKANGTTGVVRLIDLNAPDEE